MENLIIDNKYKKTIIYYIPKLITKRTKRGGENLFFSMETWGIIAAVVMLVMIIFCWVVALSKDPLYDPNYTNDSPLLKEKIPTMKFRI